MAHLRDLLSKGVEVPITDVAGNEYRIWVVRPSVLQQEEARSKASGKMARFKTAALNREGDRYDAIRLGFQEITSHEDLVATRLLYNESDIRDQAFNEVLYGEDSKWNENDMYLDLVRGITSRMAEIQTYNSEMKAGDASDRMSEDTDEELQALLKVQEEFRAEVQANVDVKLEEQKATLDGMTDVALREELMTLALDLEAQMMWYQDFQARMLFYACRYVDDKAKFYFDEPEDVLELPEYVRTILYRAYEELEKGSSDLKNSLSPPNS